MKRTIRERFAAEVRPLFPLVVSRDYEAGKVADALARIVLRGLPKNQPPAEAHEGPNVRAAIFGYNDALRDVKRKIRRKP